MRWSESSKASNSSSVGSIDSPGRSPRDHFKQVMNQEDRNNATTNWTFHRELPDVLLDQQSQDTRFAQLLSSQQRYTPSPVQSIDSQQLCDLIILSSQVTLPLKTRISISQAVEKRQANANRRADIDATDTLITAQYYSERRIAHNKATIQNSVNLPRVYQSQVQHEHELQETDEQRSLPSSIPTPVSFCFGFTDQESNTISQSFHCPVVKTHPSNLSIENYNPQIQGNYMLAASADNEWSESLYDGTALPHEQLENNQTASVGAQFEGYTFDLLRDDDILGHYAI
jgi:hypothetical protein